MNTTPQPIEEITTALATPFEASEVKFKPAAVSGQRALALAYVDARVIQDRLDDVLGVEGWQDSYRCLEDGSVLCRLRLRLGDHWVTKMDVGGPSEQPDGGDRLKAAFSDALKRAAVKFGVGRYLYRLPALWADWDPQRKQFLKTPTLPASALPPVAPAVSAQTAGKKQAASPPANGRELTQRLQDYDSKLAAEGLCAAGALVKHIVEAGVQAGFARDLATWNGAGIAFAAEQTRSFEGNLRRQKPRKEVA